jgi:hypothetical protein
MTSSTPKMMTQQKRIFSTWIFCILASFSLSSQNIPNASFDSIYIGGIDRVYQWITSDAVYFSNDTVVPFAPNTFFPPLSANHHFLTKTVQLNYFDTAAHYLNSLILTSYPALKYPGGNQFTSFIVNGEQFYSDADGIMDYRLCGSPFPYRPAYICGSYKFYDSLAPGSDFGRVEALLKRWDPLAVNIDTIATALSANELAPASVWSTFRIPFNYRSAMLPDSVVVMVSASTNKVAPTVLYIDDISFDFGTDIADIYNTRSFIEVFPNPCREAIHISPTPSEELHYRLCNLMGQVLQTGVTNHGSLDVSSLSPGSYLLELFFEDESNILKFIKI